MKLLKFFLSGPLTSFSGIEGMAYINTKYNNPRIDWPDAEIHLAAGSPASDFGFILKEVNGITEKVSFLLLKKYIKIIHPQTNFSNKILYL